MFLKEKVEIPRSSSGVFPANPVSVQRHFDDVVYGELKNRRKPRTLQRQIINGVGYCRKIRCYDRFSTVNHPSGVAETHTEDERRSYKLPETVNINLNHEPKTIISEYACT